MQLYDLGGDRIARVHAMLERNVVWYAVMVPPQKETVAEVILNRLGIDAFVPLTYRYRRVNSRVKVRKYLPYVMASRYVFVGFQQQLIPWHRLFETGIVRGALGHDGAPIALPPYTMRSLFLNSGEEDARQSAVRLNRGIVSGDTVVIGAGPFKGRRVVIEGIDRDKAAVVVEFLNQAVKVEVSLGDLEAA